MRESAGRGGGEIAYTDGFAGLGKSGRGGGGGGNGLLACPGVGAGIYCVQTGKHHTDAAPRKAGGNGLYTLYCTVQ